MSDLERKDQQILRELNQPDITVDDDETIWLLSYADLMTLLFTLFVMLYSSLIMDEGDALRKTLSTYMQGNGVNNASSPEFSDLQNSIKQRISDEQILNNLQFVANQNGLTITFSSNLFFDSGSATLSPSAEKTMIEMAKVVKEKGTGFKIRVEGHTDDTPIGEKSRFVSNWELSGARAGYIISIFEKNGFSEKDLVAVGYGASRPLQSNRMPSGEKNPEGQRQNRRVVLSIFNSKVAPTEKAQ
ncbi:MAG: OmpA family protein [Bdellovibrionota bacterium]